MQPAPWLVDTRKQPHAGAAERADLVEREARADEATRGAAAFSQSPYQPGAEAPAIYDPATLGLPEHEPIRERIGVSFEADAGSTAPMDRYNPAGQVTAHPRPDLTPHPSFYHPVSPLSSTARRL